LLYVANGFFDGGNDDDRRRSACTDTAFRTGAAASGFMNATGRLAVVTALLALRNDYIVFIRGVMPCLMRAGISHLMSGHGAVLDARVGGSVMVHAAFSRRQPSHASHGQGDDQQAQEE